MHGSYQSRGRGGGPGPDRVRGDLEAVFNVPCSGGRGAWQVRQLQEVAAQLRTVYAGENAEAIATKEQEVMRSWKDLLTSCEDCRLQVNTTTDKIRFTSMVRDLISWMDTIICQIGTGEKPRWGREGAEREHRVGWVLPAPCVGPEAHSSVVGWMHLGRGWHMGVVCETPCVALRMPHLGQQHDKHLCWRGITSTPSCHHLPESWWVCGVTVHPSKLWRGGGCAHEGQGRGCVWSVSCPAWGRGRCSTAKSAFCPESPGRGTGAASSKSSACPLPLSPSLPHRDVSSVEVLMNYHQGLKSEIETRSRNIAACAELGKALVLNKSPAAEEVDQPTFRDVWLMGGYQEETLRCPAPPPLCHERNSSQTQARLQLGGGRGHPFSPPLL